MMQHKKNDITDGSTTIKTVGELKKALANIPDDTKIVRISNGYYQVKKNDVSFWYGKWKNNASESRIDEFPDDNLVIDTI